MERERYTNDKYVAFIRQRSSDLKGSCYLIVGWEDGGRPSIVWEDVFHKEYKLITEKSTNNDERRF